MSNNPNSGFNASAWQNASQKQPSDGFKVLYANEKKTNVGSDGFVASFVSKEKAHALSRQQVKGGAEDQIHQSDDGALQKAYEEGFAKGEQDGLLEGRAKAQDMVARLSGILADTEAAWNNIISAYETQIIDLVCKATEKVVYSQVSLDQEVVKRAILKAFDAVPEPVQVEIQISPSDYEYIETIKEDFFSTVKGLKDVMVSPNPAIQQGGCQIQTRFGEVNATLENRLEAIRQCLMTANGRKTN